MRRSTYLPVRSSSNASTRHPSETNPAQVIGERQPTIPSKRPHHPRRRRQRSRRRAAEHEKNHRHHPRAPSTRARGLRKHRHERILRGWRRADLVNVPETKHHRDEHTEAEHAVDEHAHDHRVRHDDGRILDLFRHVDRAVRTDKGEDETYEAYEEGEPLRRPSSRIHENRKDLLRGAVWGKIDQRDQYGDKSHYVQYQDHCLYLCQNTADQRVDTKTTYHHCPSKKGALPVSRVIGWAGHDDHSLNRCASEECS